MFVIGLFCCYLFDWFGLCCCCLFVWFAIWLVCIFLCLCLCLLYVGCLLFCLWEITPDKEPRNTHTKNKTTYRHKPTTTRVIVCVIAVFLGALCLVVVVFVRVWFVVFCYFALVALWCLFVSCLCRMTLDLKAQKQDNTTRQTTTTTLFLLLLCSVVICLFSVAISVCFTVSGYLCCFVCCLFAFVCVRLPLLKNTTTHQTTRGDKNNKHTNNMGLLLSMHSCDVFCLCLLLLCFAISLIVSVFDNVCSAVCCYVYSL